MAEKRRRIAIFTGQADEDYQNRFISGFLKRAFENNMDACIFSMYLKFQDTQPRERGESNIFRLFNPKLFDGVVILKDTIQTPNEAEELEKRLHEEFTGPVLIAERESELFPSVFTDGYVSMRAIIRHLIEVHGYKDIAFLNGKRWHAHSKQRLQAFLDEMNSHGLSVPEDRIIYGDFWYSSGETCAEKLVEAGDLPEAVACANDCMAIGLCNALEKRGISVPDQIAVVSYDSSEEGQTSPKPITSAQIPAGDLGTYAADYMEAKFTGKEIGPFETKTRVLIGETCGCTELTLPEIYKRRKCWETDISEAGFNSVHNTMAENLLSQISLQEYVNTVYAYAYQIKDAENFYLCLCEQWAEMDQDMSLHVRNEGYPEKMIYAVRYNQSRRKTWAGLEKSFQTAEILPELSKKKKTPCAYFFTPVFHENECYGYACVSYGNVPRSYDEIYRRWIKLVSRGLESIRRYSVIQQMEDQISKLHTNKYAQVRWAYENLPDAQKEDYDLVTKILDENLLTYHFQPIVRATDGSVFSYEALMRSNTEKRISPLDIIKYANMQGRLADVERATFTNVLTIAEREREAFGDAKVFLNSIPGVQLSEEECKPFEDMLIRNSGRIVVELTEETELSDEDLDELKEYFKKNNIETAVDDYGTGYSNVNNLLRYMPNYVKIDRSLLSDIPNKPQKRYFVREVIDFCHDNGIMALAEGVETVEELRVVIHLGADLIQGYYTARPAAEIITSIDESIREEIKSFHAEYKSGTTQYTYLAGRTNRVSLGTLSRSGYTEISVGQETPVYKDITVFGTPGAATSIHIGVADGYSGIITLENVDFSGVRGVPCISIGENCEITLVLNGENIKNKEGILIAESAKVTYEGEGSLI